MKKVAAIVILTGALFNQAFSNEEMALNSNIHSSHNYFAIGVGPLPLPALTLSIGRRQILSEKFSADMGVCLATLIRANALRGYINGLCYFHQRPLAQNYFGIGGSIGSAFLFEKWCGSGYVAPNIIFGREFLNSTSKKRFFQVEAMYPIVALKDWEVIHFPLLTLKYGMAF